MKRTQSKKYGNKPSKTFIAEQYFLNTNKTNEEIAIILTQDISKTTTNQVEVMRTRWKDKLQKKISSHPELSKQVRKTITSADFKNSFLSTCTSISEEVEKRVDKFNNKETIDLFSNVVGLAKGGD